MTWTSPVGVVEEPELDRDEVTAEASAHLDGVAAAREREQRVDRHDEGVPRRCAVVIETCTGAWSSRPVAAGCVGVTSTSIVGLPPPPLSWPVELGVVATVPT